MKKLFLLFLVASVGTALSVRAIEIPADSTAHFLKVEADAITIDGVIGAEWAAATQYDITRVWKGDTLTPSDCSGWFKGAWSDDGLYVVVNVTDNIHYTAAAYGASYEKDKAEVYINTNANLYAALGPGTAGSSNGHSGGYFQLAPLADDTIVTPSWITGGAVKVKLTGTNYVQEAFFPWDAIKDADGNAVDPSIAKIGFDVDICDNDGPVGHAARRRVVWSNDYSVLGAEDWTNMSNAGKVVFEIGTAVKTVTTNSFKAYAVNNLLTVKGINTNDVIRVYDVMGKEVLTSTKSITSIAHLANGIYIVKAGNHTQKFIKR